ncbi:MULTISPECIES: VraH family peptide resistance protein [Staphylococcus]|uniref:VraH family peptide resistance protein n=1 Tax=Staphylococcus TaxID=1279 RepID=UPI0002E6FED8|nr:MULTISPECIES: hypothetical protein [Staphylococcus]MBM6506730.1 VraH family protein [Staphylococcus pasteuri]MEB6612052.1 VraH family protein [Staphylococcus pasteuri]QQN53588.1 VraH family protein [Staphylococcus pasteuri]QQT21498.1 VraH family protein [Staphylococcus pasteuri]VXC54373.1 conserved hypothetical protein [Staphylococcus sp. 8AQ]
MSLKEMWKYLINKKWDAEDVLFLITYMIIASIFTTPLFGIPIGIIVYLLMDLYDD